MKQLKKMKFSLPNTGLLFIIAGMAVANYSYENYQKKYMSSSTKYNVDMKAKELPNQPNDFVNSYSDSSRDRAPGSIETVNESDDGVAYPDQNENPHMSKNIQDEEADDSGTISRRQRRNRSKEESVEKKTARKIKGKMARKIPDKYLKNTN